MRLPLPLTTRTIVSAFIASSRYEARIVPGRHGGKDMVVGAILRLPQGIQRPYGLIRHISYRRDPLLVALAVPDGHELVLKVDIIPA